MMKDLYEQSDTLERPFEALLFDPHKFTFPVQSHWHYFTEMIFILQGIAIVKTNGTEYTLCPGDFILFFPQSIHSINGIEEDDSLLFYVLKFDINRLNFQTNYIPNFKDLLKGASSEQQLPIAFHQSDFPDVDIHSIFSHCVKEVSHTRYGYDARIQCDLSIMLLEIVRIWIDSGFEPSYLHTKSQEEYTIHDILLYIEENIQTSLHVHDLAKICHMSYSYFAKCFHSLYGQSCKEYIEFVRLSKAENLLLFTNTDLSYISSETGFSDCSHFIRVFKRKYGITPKQFRLQKHNLFYHG